MKTKTVYVCEFCGSEHTISTEALKCEAKCLGLTKELYEEYIKLLNEEKMVFIEASGGNNARVRERCNNVVNAIFAFQKKYNLPYR